MARWLGAVKWRLENARLPLWIPVDEDEDSQWPREMELGNGRWRRIWCRCSDAMKGYMLTRHNDNDMAIELQPRSNGRRMRLNLRALSEAQLQAAAMEAGAPLQELLPQHPDHYDHRDHHDYELDGGPQPISPTHHRLGRMISVLGNFAFAVSIGQDLSRVTNGGESQSDTRARPRSYGSEDSGAGSLTLVELEREEKRMFAIRIAIALCIFFTFWLVSCQIASR